MYDSSVQNVICASSLDAYGTLWVVFRQQEGWCIQTCVLWFSFFITVSKILFGITASLSLNCLPLSFFVSMKFLNYIHIGTFCDKMENFHNIFHFPKGAAFLQNFVVQILKLLLWFLRIISAFQTLWQNCCQSGLHIIYQNLDSSIGIHHLWDTGLHYLYSTFTVHIKYICNKPDISTWRKYELQLQTFS